MLTCFGGASRNRSVGVRLGKGETMEAIIASMKEVAEGVPTAGAALALAQKLGLYLPLTHAIADVIAGRAEAAPTVRALMLSPGPGPEQDQEQGR